MLSPPSPHPVFVSGISSCQSQSHFSVSVGSCLKDRREETCQHKNHGKKATTKSQAPPKSLVRGSFSNHFLIQLYSRRQYLSDYKASSNLDSHTPPSKLEHTAKCIHEKKTNLQAQPMPHPEQAAELALQQNPWQQTH